jgi:hypothetical protein
MIISIGELTSELVHDAMDYDDAMDWTTMVCCKGR